MTTEEQLAWAVDLSERATALAEQYGLGLIEALFILSDDGVPESARILRARAALIGAGVTSE